MAKCKLTAVIRNELKKLITDFDNARSALYDRLDEIAGEWSDEFDDASDRWQQSDAGQEAEVRINQIQEARDSIENPAIDINEL